MFGLLNKEWITCIPFFILTLFLIGCNTPQEQLINFNANFTNSDYSAAASFAKNKIYNEKYPKAEDLLWTLQLAAIQNIQHYHQQSNTNFDTAEDMMKYFDHKGDLGDIIGTIAVNQNITPYKGTQYDRIMVNTYKALNFISLEKDDLARVEFNRALDRQRRAKEKFNKEIEQARGKLAHKKRHTHTDATLENPEFQRIIKQRYSNLENFEAYPDFINPFTTYIAGIFFALQNDYQKSRDLLKESFGMVPSNEFIARDLQAVENAAQADIPIENTVWLFFENGLGPIKRESRIDLPLFVASDQVEYFGIALPEIHRRRSAYQSLTVKYAGQNIDTQTVCDMDKVVQTEFNKEFPNILTAAIISASAKAAAQYSISQKRDSKAEVLTSLMASYTFLTTAADVRIWTTLPKNFQVARFAKPVDGKFYVFTGDKPLVQIDVTDCNNAIVYMKIPTYNSPLNYEVIKYR